MHDFYDRRAAGRLLASRLQAYQNTEAVVLAIPRGGLPIADEVAKSLGLPVDVVLVKKIGHPANQEYAIGAVSLTDQMVIPQEGVDELYVAEEVKKIRKRLEEMRRSYLGEKKPLKVNGRTVLLIDDGIATGETLFLTIRMLKKEQPAKIVVAVPVSSASAYRKIKQEVDELVCLLVPKLFVGVGAYYVSFRQVSDEEVQDCLLKRTVGN